MGALFTTRCRKTAKDVLPTRRDVRLEASRGLDLTEPDPGVVLSPRGQGMANKRTTVNALGTGISSEQGLPKPNLEKINEEAEDRGFQEFNGQDEEERELKEYIRAQIRFTSKQRASNYSVEWKWALQLMKAYPNQDVVKRFYSHLGEHFNLITLLYRWSELLRDEYHTVHDLDIFFARDASGIAEAYPAKMRETIIWTKLLDQGTDRCETMIDICLRQNCMCCRIMPTGWQPCNYREAVCCQNLLLKFDTTMFYKECALLGLFDGTEMTVSPDESNG